LATRIIREGLARRPKGKPINRKFEELKTLLLWQQAAVLRNKNYPKLPENLFQKN
jgi:hypothetical protein